MVDCAGDGVGDLPHRFGYGMERRWPARALDVAEAVSCITFGI